MMEDFMGTDDFRKGLTAFLRKFSYKTAVTEDLLNELSSASAQNLNMSNIMGTWTRQKGFPVVIVEKSEKGCVLRQERFLTSNNKSDVPSPYNYKWEVPISYVSSKDTKNIHRTWLRPSDENLLL